MKDSTSPLAWAGDVMATQHEALRLMLDAINAMREAGNTAGS